MRYSHQIFYFLLFLLAVTSADIIFHNFLTNFIQHYLKNRLSSGISFLTDSLKPAPLTPQPPSQTITNLITILLLQIILVIHSQNWGVRVLSPTRGYSPCIHQHNQYYGVFTSCSQFFFSSWHPGCSASSWRNVVHLFPCIFTRICFGFLKKTLWFSPWLLMESQSFYSWISKKAS